MDREELRSLIARTVDPAAWARRDADALRRDYFERELAVAWSGTSFEEWVERSIRPSLVKADAILTALDEAGVHCVSKNATEELRESVARKVHFQLVDALGFTPKIGLLTKLITDAVLEILTKEPGQ